MLKLAPAALAAALILAAPLPGGGAHAHEQRGDENARCLALSMYWEAKGEGREGMLAVGSVVLNRMRSDEFPDTSCEVEVLYKVVGRGTGLLARLRSGDTLAAVGPWFAGYVRDTGSTIFHPTSTCRMGPDPSAVVDERLRVHGMAGLRVADASIMPTMVSGNTNAAAIMIGEKASDLIAEDHRP